MHGMLSVKATCEAHLCIDQRNRVLPTSNKYAGITRPAWIRLFSQVTRNFGQDTVDYLKLQAHLVRGWACKEIPALTKRIDVDLVVMGTICRSGVPGFIMGNTAEMILNQVDCSVLAVKPLSFVTPVTVEG